MWFKNRYNTLCHMNPQTFFCHSYNCFGPGLFSIEHLLPPQKTGSLKCAELGIPISYEYTWFFLKLLARFISVILAVLQTCIAAKNELSFPTGNSGSVQADHAFSSSVERDGTPAPVSLTWRRSPRWFSCADVPSWLTSLEHWLSYLPYSTSLCLSLFS